MPTTIRIPVASIATDSVPEAPENQHATLQPPIRYVPTAQVLRVHGMAFEFGAALDIVTAGPVGCQCQSCSTARGAYAREEAYRARLAGIAVRATAVSAELAEKALTGRVPTCRDCTRCILPVCGVCHRCTYRGITPDQFKTYMLVMNRQEPEDYMASVMGLLQVQPRLDEAGAMQVFARNKFEVCCSCNICNTCNTPMAGATYCRECGQHVGCSCQCWTCSACERRHSRAQGPQVVCEHCKGVVGCCCRCSRCSRCAEVQPSTMRGPVGELLANRCQNCGYCLNCCRCAAVDDARLPMPRANDERGVVFQRAVPKFWSPSPSWGLVEAGVPHPNQLNPYKRFIGQEIEVGGNGTLNMNRVVVKTWKGAIVSDGSLPSSGFEINTAPAGGDMFVRQIQEIVKECERTEAWVDTCCGLHTHVDTSDFNIWAMRRLINLYRRVEPHMYSMLPYYRQSNHYCEKCGDNWWKVFNDPGKVRELKSRSHSTLDKGAPSRNLKGQLVQALYGRGLPGQPNPGLPSYAKKPEDKSGETAKREAVTLKARKRNKSCDTRYRGLNVHSWMLRGTLEFRMGAPAIDILTREGGSYERETPRALIKGDYIVNWGIVCASVVEAAAKWSDSQVDKFGKTTRTAGASCTWEEFRDSVLPSSLRKWADETREFIVAQPKIR